ncbi:MAG: efflux RND transporter periplasmic adaptor subunit [Proteobacteria bacterium]|jgi:HlyD family secretion protein|nr:efflux RND transporter periplasmic adaptor subunit [Pseudomonadota bacterium]
MVKNESNVSEDVGATLGLGRHSAGHRRRLWLVAALAAILLMFVAYLFLAPSEGPALRFETAEVEKGDLTVTVTATGTVQPVNQVDVGSELSGIIDSVYVDFNDQVKRGQMLARLDTVRLEAQVIQSRALLDSARAKQEEAAATVVETRLRYQRCQKLAARKLCTGEELDTSLAAKARAKAAEASAMAQVAVAQAALKAQETNLAKAEIRSPIDGLVLKRQIEPGQTVAASLQAPVLFTLAEDLTHMELHVAVDEADVGKVADGQSALFSVDAYPDRSYPARITQVRYAPQTLEGVVTYETVLLVDNSDLSLRPGMTATAVITVRELKDVILVPNAALRFTPPVTKTAKRGGGIFGSMFRRPSSRRRPDANGNAEQKIWILRDGQPTAVTVKAGASDGKYTELRSADIQPGQQVIVDAISVKK